MIRRERCPSGEWLAVGLDGKNRLVVRVHQHDDKDGLFFEFHGMMPPSGKTLRGTGLEGEHERF